MRLPILVAMLALGSACGSAMAFSANPATPADAMPPAVAEPLDPLLPDEPVRELLHPDAESHAATIPASSRANATVVAGTIAASMLSILGFSLYSRIRPHATLDNDTRKQIFETVCAHPGQGVHAIAHATGVSYSTATYHLERLVQASMIVMTPDGNKLRYYQNGGAFSETERRILPLVKNEEAAKLLDAILERPGTYRAELAEKLGVTATTINWHLRRLRDAGLVQETRIGRNAYLHPALDAVREHLTTLATKVANQDADAAARLRRYAAHGHVATPAGGA